MGALLVEDALAQHQGFGIAGDLLEAGIDRQEAELVIEDEDAFRGVFEHRGGQPLLLLGLAVLGDVPAGADHAQGAALVGPLHHPAVVLDPAPATIGVAQAVDGVITVNFALEVQHHGTADAGQVIRVDQGFQIAEEVLEVGAVIAQQLVEIGVVVAAGIQHPVPQADVAGFQRQLQPFPGGSQRLVGVFQCLGPFVNHGFQPFVGFLQALTGFLSFVDFLGELFVEGLGIAAGPVQVVDQRTVAGLQHHRLVAGVVDAAGGDQEKDAEDGSQHQ